MKLRPLALVVLSSCSVPAPADSIAPTTADVTTTTAQSFDLGDLPVFEPMTVNWGETELVVALADDEAERGRGLMEVTDLGDFDGMLFAWSEPVTTGFFMKDTLIALDLFFFDGDGALVDQTTLQPCTADPCPVFVADGLFRWVLEAPSGSIEATGKLSFPGAD